VKNEVFPCDGAPPAATHQIRAKFRPEQAPRRAGGNTALDAVGKIFQIDIAAFKMI
jgi:hypothetical protein